MSIQPPFGFIPQYYRQAHDYSFDALKQQLDLWKTAGCTGAAVHGVTSELDPATFEKHAREITQRGLLAFAAFGLNSDTPEEKGQRIALVASHPMCSGVLFDMEGAWEDETTDKAKAKAMGHVFRAGAPNAWATDQPWPVPTVHWSMFPWEEAAEFVNYRSPQYYYNDWKAKWGRERYAKCNTLFTSSWAQLDARLLRTQHVDPEIVTIEGFGWEDIFADLVGCLLCRPSAFIWSEPFPRTHVLEGLRCVRTLANLGFTGAQAVLQFQQDYNRTATTKLSVDGRCGLLETAPRLLGRTVDLT